MHMPPRVNAFLIHLAASALIACVAMALVFLVWYPAPLATAIGVTPIFLLMLGIDVTLGPLLTLVVYKPGKKSLRMDLSIIVLLQVGALVYGLHTMAIARPAWIVFNADRFDVVQALEVEAKYADRATPQFKNAPWTGPRWAASAAPASQEDSQALMFEALDGGADLPQRIDLYSPIEQSADAIRAKALPLSDLDKYNPPSEVASVLKEWPDADAFLPLMAKEQPMTVLLRKADSKVIAIVALNPWL